MSAQHFMHVRNGRTLEFQLFDKPCIAIVGSPEQVAARIYEYQALGIDCFILSGYPHLEEAYRFAELVFPLLKLNHGRPAFGGVVNNGPFGETIANDLKPDQKRASSS